jgi:hypothetical protein
MTDDLHEIASRPLGRCRERTVSSPAETTFVTDRLAAGLARQAIRDWRRQAERAQSRVAELTAQKFSTGKAARRLARDLLRVVDPVAFVATSIDLKRRGVLQVWTVPDVLALGGEDYLAVELCTLCVKTAGIEAGIARHLLLVHTHALARLFMRLQTVALSTIREELTSTLNVCAALRDAGEALALKQLVFPTRSGAFRCDLSDDFGKRPLLVAKTWISKSTLGERDSAVCASIESAGLRWYRKATLEERVCGLGIPAASIPQSFVAALTEALRPHAWLSERYVERPDHLSAMWEAARQQMKSDGR